MDTDTQLTSGSAFITGDVIAIGSSSASTSASTSAFTLMAWYASWEDAGDISLHRLRSSSESIRFYKTSNAAFIMAVHTSNLEKKQLRTCLSLLSEYLTKRATPRVQEISIVACVFVAAGICLRVAA
jgi:hypothetical protein